MSLTGSSRRIWIALCLCGLLAVPACRRSVSKTEVVTFETEAEGGSDALADPSQPSQPPPPTRDASDDFFDNGVIPTLKIELKEAQAKKLREDARHYVKCKLIETIGDSQTTYAEVAIKLKGAAVS